MTWCFGTNIPFPKGHISYVEEWPMMQPCELAFLIFTYLMFVFSVGPYIMENRRPMQMKWFLVTFNAAKVLNSVVLSYKFISYIKENGLFPRNCEHDDSTVYLIASLYWKYMITKILDLFDTIFFVLRKKKNQITFLHVYHHLFMLIVTWVCLKYDPTDHWGLLAILNSSVHIVMYVYYGVAALGSEYLKYLWWKKYLTIMQLSQFVLVGSHMVIQAYTSECPIHNFTYWVGLANTTLFFILFIDFYIKRYQSKITGRVGELACSSHVE